MYSVVLMLAVTSTNQVPDCHRQRSTSCCGYVASYGCCGYAPPVYYYGCCGYAPPVYYSGCCGGGVIPGSKGTPKVDDAPMTKEDEAALMKLGATKEAIEKMKKEKTTHKKAMEQIEMMKKDKPKGNEESDTSAPATVVVNVPVGTNLYFDNQATASSTSEKRVFTTPTLAAGRTFEYTVKAERLVDGVKQVVTEKVLVKSGSQTAVVIDFAKTQVVLK